MKNKIAIASAFLAATSFSMGEIVINDFLSFEGFVDMSYSHTDVEADDLDFDASDNSFNIDQVEIDWLFDFDPVTAQIDLQYENAANGDDDETEVEQAFVTYHMDGELEHAIRNLPDVIGFLGAEKGGDPLPLRQAEVNRILGKVDELAESEEEINIPFYAGETVKVVDGPFNGFSGIIEEVNEEKKKLKVMVKIFGRKSPLELSYMQVEKES